MENITYSTVYLKRKKLSTEKKALVIGRNVNLFNILYSSAGLSVKKKGEKNDDEKQTKTEQK